ncbi:glycosyltransferase [Oerskovia sp. USHLN155]|uniref:glycosyltransferase n=1 Tax=Oerskovia sp. USHLN155 TaxID=3081288 RepID=UPI0030187837
MHEDERVTVVVMSRDRREELLASLPRHRAAVVLVDNGSSDGSADAVGTSMPHVSIVRLGTDVGALARTIGVARARTPFVAFADDDSWWSPGALRAGADLLDGHPRVAAVVGRVLVGPDEVEDPVVGSLRASPLGGAGLPGPRVLGFMACATMLRREAFLAVGGFDPLVRFPGEEEPLALRLAASGWALVYAEGLVVHHYPSPHRATPGARAAQIARSSLTSALLLLPWRTVLARAAGFARAGSWERRGLFDALPTVVPALRRRVVVPESVRRDLDAISGTDRG